MGLRLRFQQLTLLFLALGIASGCSFDQDEAYAPQTAGAIFLLQDDAGAFSLLYTDGSVALSNWEQQLSQVPTTVQHLDGISGEACWLADGGGRQIMRIQPEGAKVTATWPTGAFFPHFICEGNTEILVSDTTRQQALLIRKKDGRHTTLELGGHPGLAAYRSGVFFVVVSDTLVQLVHEKALVVSGQTETEAPVAYLDWDGKFSMSVFFQKEALYEQKIDYNTRTSTGSSRITDQYRRYSPYPRINFGEEWTTTLAIRQDTLRPWNIGNVDTFFPDFLHSSAWIQVNDTLKQVYADGTSAPLKVITTRNPVRCWYWVKEIKP